MRRPLQRGTRDREGRSCASVKLISSCARRRLSCIEHQTTNLGVRSSNPFGRASFRQFPCESHGIHTASDPGNREHVRPTSSRSDFESKGREFESLRARQQAPENTGILLRPLNNASRRYRNGSNVEAAQQLFLFAPAQFTAVVGSVLDTRSKRALRRRHGDVRAAVS
jgi:hypothetical protein